jgi:hypothetical protein
MDEQRFEAMTRWVATKPSRRDVLKVLVATVVVAVLALFRPQRAGAGSIIPGCRLPGQRCDGDENCCTNFCPASYERCGCLLSGDNCFFAIDPVLLPGVGFDMPAMCCTGKCQNSKCVVGGD